nr:transposase [Mycobacterium avium]
MRSLKSRGLAGVQLVITDAHAGLPSAIIAVRLGAAWQPARVPLLQRGLGPWP